ncbi:MAG: adenylate/guanylate cyclase domain-containing protein [Arenicellales bacterium]|nr:adenylate/guanylate cyclase domain-containing protein [Arenicellales bacterium]
MNTNFFNLAPARDQQLPARVRAAIQRQQALSEVIIGWIQLGVVLTFWGLYTLAPKTFSEDAAFEPVPWVLACYLAFTLFRLILAHRKRLPDWFLYISVVIDMTLLMALIWSFHLQYEQPPSFYLKAPTLLYVFIFIALRALRFEARFVIAAGVTAAVGWLLMVWYVISNDSMEITRDYVKYMTSNSVLLGAEFDKVITILMVTIILAVALYRARNLLIESVVESTKAKDLSRFVPSEVVKQVQTSADGVTAGQGELKQTTILFGDLEGFTSLSEELSPTELINTLNEYFAAVVEPIERYGGVVTQFQGDAILASFNQPKADDDHAANAVRAAIDIQKILSSKTFGKGRRLRSRIGINSGVVVGGLVGTHDRLGYTVHGDDVNLAARLEQLNKDYGTYIIVSASTRELAGPDRFPFKKIGEVQVRGRHSDTTIYTINRGQYTF